MTFVFLDTETTGINPDKHEVWEIAYAVDDGPVLSSVVWHTFKRPDPAALRVNGYLDRTRDRNPGQENLFEVEIRRILRGAILVGANPAFDAAFLRARWDGATPWHYRLLDVEAYAMGALGYDEPKGLAKIREDLVGLGFEIPEPDHSAARDVEVVRAAYRALQRLYTVATFAPRIVLGVTPEEFYGGTPAPGMILQERPGTAPFGAEW